MSDQSLPQIVPLTNKRIKDIAGQRFGRLAALGYVGSNDGGRAVWLCLCDCGQRIVAEGKGLRSGNTRSCGCLQRDITGGINRSHGQTETLEYRIWCNMRTRCNNPNTPVYSRYGGRGIAICEQWNSFERFFADMGLCPGPEYSLDRIDNDGPYSPENCRWATLEEQANNKRNNRILTHDGKTMTINEWARETGIKVGTIYNRIDREGWSIAKAVTTPTRPMRRPTKKDAQV